MNNLITLVIGIALIIWANVRIDGAHAAIDYRIIATSAGSVVVFASFFFWALDKERKRKAKFENDAKAFFENFIQNCQQSERLDSVQTAYFGKWAQQIMGKKVTTMPGEKNIASMKITEHTHERN